MNNNPNKTNPPNRMSKPFVQKASIESTLTTAYRDPYAGNYYSWYGHEALHKHVTRQAAAAEPIHEPEVLRLLGRAYPFSQTRAMKPSAEDFKQFYAKQRKRLVNLRKDIEMCAAKNFDSVKPTYIAVRAPAYGRKKRYIITLYTTPNDDIASWKEEVMEHNKSLPWSAKERVQSAKHYADFMKSLNDNINYLANFDPTPYVEKHLLAIKVKDQERSVDSAQSYIKSNLQKIADNEASLLRWLDPEYIEAHAAKQRLHYIKSITEATERVKEFVKRLIEHGVELTEEQQAFAPEVTE